LREIQEKRQLVRPRRGWEDNVKKSKEMGKGPALKKGTSDGIFKRWQ
jgi:hypothetical protein